MSSCHAQANRVRLTKVLKDLESKYGLSFSYKDENVSGIKVSAPDYALPYQEILKSIENETNLGFELLSERYIAVTRAPALPGFFCGKVQDDSGELLSGAVVLFDNGFTLTDADGRFEIAGLHPTDEATITFFGYEPMVVRMEQLGREDCPSVIMTYAIQELEEVVVKDFITEGISKNIYGAFVVNTGQLKILPGLAEPDVLKSLQVIPGIQSVDESVSNLNVRGGTNDQNLVLWDGIRMYQTGHFFGLISAFNPFIIKKATLTRNGSLSALHDGVSSTISMETDDNQPDGVALGAGVNMLNADAYLSLPIGKKSFVQLSGRRSLSDWLETPTYKQYFERAFRDADVVEDLFNPDSSRVTSNERFSFNDFTFKFVTKPNRRSQLKLNLISIRNNITYDENAILNNMPEIKTSNLSQTSVGARLAVDHRWSPKFNTHMQIYLSSYKLASVNFDVLNDRRVEQVNEVLDIGIKLDGKILISDRVALSNGYQFSEVGISDLQNINVPRFEALNQRVLQRHSLFTEGEFSWWGDKADLRTGVRLDYIPKLNETWIGPRLALHLKMNDHWSTQVLGELKNQYSNQVIDFQTDFLGIEKRKWQLSDGGNIPVATSRQVSVGLQYERNSLLIGTEAYYKQVSGIAAASQGFLNQFQFRKEVGSYQSVGMDFIVNYRAKNMSVWAGYSLLDHEYDFPTFDPPDFPGNLDIRHTVNAGFNININKFQFSSGANWHTGAPFTEAEGVASGILFADPNASRLKHYFRSDVSVKYFFKVGSSRIMAGASVWNIFDRENVNGFYWRVNSDGAPERIAQLALGFTPNLTLRVDLP